ncbi:Flp pilus assembly complex ATPase component TadA [Candidatus Woesearchaeota archaeon]|nr:Flp pilus assembly complex ATPase component TadA [Candidatus Woesearchaeota archaeon]
MPVYIRIFKKEGDFVPTYELNIKNISKNTEVVLEKIREELITEVSLGALDLTETKNSTKLKEKFEKTINNLIEKYFINLNEKTKQFICNYLIQKCLGLGRVEILLTDTNLEEITINSAQDPVWVYHKVHGWLKTNIIIDQEKIIKHYASVIARQEGKSITMLEPLLDAHMSTGNRVNATLSPISVKGNTITIRKFASKPWTITDVIKNKTISVTAAAIIWLGIQYEMSTLVTGGTASGKTSMLNILSTFFPPNQRIISIEDTRELQLPSFLHWVPMTTRLPNPEGKGAVAMLDLLVNALRQRPDRIIVGEIRRKQEAEVLLEAIHTGHSVYGTLHANDAHETVIRLTNPPIDLPKAMIPAISMIIVQNRNRRTGLRRTFQIAEILPNAEPNIIGQLDLKKDMFDSKISQSEVLTKELLHYIGMSRQEINADIKEKSRVLKWLVKKNINTVDEVGHVIAKYYTNKAALLKQISKG